MLRHYIQRYYRPERITISGVNVDHDELVRQCEKYFHDTEPSWLSEEIVKPDESIAQYVGGILKVGLAFLDCYSLFNLNAVGGIFYCYFF